MHRVNSVDYIRFVFLAVLKTLGYLFYPSKLDWVSRPPDDWSQVSLVLILNHTSLFEFVYGVAVPYRFLWLLSRRLVIPVADVTLSRPIAGFILSRLSPKTIGISRKRDESWQKFLAGVHQDDICIFMPEGQMKRKDGLNKDGGPMVVRHGVYELLSKFRGKNMLLVYSKGLHHVLAPGDVFPKIFKKIEASVEFLEVNTYLSQFSQEEQPRKALAKDLQTRRDRYCGF